MAMVYNDNTGNYEWQEDEFDPYAALAPPPEYSKLPPAGRDPDFIPPRLNPTYDTMPMDETGQVDVRHPIRERAADAPTAPYDPYPTSNYPTSPTQYGGYQAPQRHALAALNYPPFNAPQFTAPAPFSYGDFSYDPFSYESFQAPTIAEAQSEPGFDYALTQGLKAYENSKAYLGTYKTGGTIKGLNDYARNMANQNYNDVYRRKGETYDRNRGNAFGNYSANRENAFGNWSANRENAADAYATNYGISRDVYDRKYTAAKDEYQPRARAAELEFARDWDVYAYEGDDDYRRWKAQIDANSP